MRNYRFWLAAVFLTVAFPVDAGDWITMAVTPRQAFSPTNLTVRVTVQPNADNRTLQVVADSQDFYRSSQIQLHGEAAPRSVTVEFRAVPSGNYDVTGVLRDGTGQPRAMARQQAVVLPSGGR